MSTESVFVLAFIINLLTVGYAIIGFRLTKAYSLSQGGLLAKMAVYCAVSVVLLGSHHLAEVVTINGAFYKYNEFLEITAGLIFILSVSKLYQMVRI